MTPQERIAALELSNQRLRQALEYIREEYLFTAHGFHVASKALSSSEPSKVVEVLRQCEEALSDLFKLMDEGRLVRNTEDDHKPEFYTEQAKLVSRLKSAIDARDALREILG